MHLVCAEISCDMCGETESMQDSCIRVRKHLKQCGWVQRGSKDYCPACAQLILQRREKVYSNS